MCDLPRAFCYEDSRIIDDLHKRVAKAESQARDSWEKYLDCKEAYDAVRDKLEQCADALNWQGRVTHALLPDQPGDISSGRALDIIGRWKKMEREVANVLDHFDQLPNDIATDLGMWQLTRAIKQLREVTSGH